MAETDAENALWSEYKAPFSGFDDLTLARWLAQTLGQLEGRLWRMSHPLYTAYRVAASVGNDRDIWHKRLANFPAVYPSSECCDSPLLPVFTRNVVESGLLCGNCGETAITFDDLPADLRSGVESWAENYGNAHAVAHYDENQMRTAGDYDKIFEKAASEAENYLRIAAMELLPRFLDHYPVLIWEDQDECLEIGPTDIPTWQ
jgi:hypothetical protein